MATKLTKSTPYALVVCGKIQPSLDYFYGVWDSLDAAWLAISGNEAYNEDISQGLTIAVKENDVIVEYQLKKKMPAAGYTKSDFEKKNSGGSVKTVSVNNGTKVSPDASGNVNLTVTTGGTVKSISCNDDDEIYPNTNGKVILPAASTEDYGVVTFKSGVQYSLERYCGVDEDGCVVTYLDNATSTTYGLVKSSKSSMVSGSTQLDTYTNNGVMYAMAPNATYNETTKAYTAGFLSKTDYEKILSAYKAVCEAFDNFVPNKLYSVGDVVFHNDTLYEFVEAYQGANFPSGSDLSKVSVLSLKNIKDACLDAVETQLSDLETYLQSLLGNTSSN